MQKNREIAAISLGDYRYALKRDGEGIFYCAQELIDGSQTDEIRDWSNLPPQVQEFFQQQRVTAA